MSSFIPPDNPSALWALIALGTAFAIWLEKNYRWAAKLSSPVLALLIAMALSNTRVAPAESPAYDFIGDWLVPLAIPLLLFRANLREIVKTGGRMLLVFHISSAGTILGVWLAVLLLRGAIASPDLEHAAGMMAASYIGGSVNFMAVKTSYHVREAVTNPLIVADNFVMGVIFVALLAIAGSRWFRSRYPHPHSLPKSDEPALAAAGDDRKPIAVLDLAWSFGFAFAVLAVATLLGGLINAGFGDVSHQGWAIRMLAVLCGNKFVLITGITLVLATILARPLSRVNGAEECGSYFLLLFLFTLGLPADFVGVVRQAPMFFVFCAVIAITNLAFTLIVGKVLRFDLEEVLLAVNANLGGAPSAAAMATTAGWSRLVLPGILVAIWGYVIGTPIGVVVVQMFSTGK